ncbi:hypothetical protein JAAARDRAFT_125785, partial [Jaapia argillacea MUCL 33604]
QLRELAEACDPATFGMNQQDVYDESYRKAGKLDLRHFATHFNPDTAGLAEVIRENLLEGKDDNRPIGLELYKLNVYGPGSFFKAHKDTPRAPNMFGSLVVVFPAKHEGGALVLRHQNSDWTFDAAKELSNTQQPQVAYIAFYSNVEHEVMEVQSGYRISLTYNLYFTKSRPQNTPALPQTQSRFLRALRSVLDDRTFLPYGGTLGFGLRHQYPLPEEGDLTPLESCLKGSDAVVMEVCRYLGLDVSLRAIYDDDEQSVMMNHLPAASKMSVGEGRSIVDAMCEDLGGVLVDGDDDDDDDDDEMDEDESSVVWVTQSSAQNRDKRPYIYYGNESSLSFIYGEVYLIARVRPFNRRAVA